MNIFSQWFIASANDGTLLIGGQEGDAAVTTAEQVQVQEQAAPAAGGIWITMAIWGAVIVGMYFLLLRPQRKREKAVRDMQLNLKVNDNVVTSSGFYGKIVGVGTDAFLVEFGENRGLKVWVRKTDIAGIKSPVMTPPKED